MISLVLIVVIAKLNTFSSIVVPFLPDEDYCINLGRSITTTLQSVNKEVSTTIYCEPK